LTNNYGVELDIGFEMEGDFRCLLLLLCDCSKSI